jgi:HAD superfamily hydrolase (TIGR01509 family)
MNKAVIFDMDGLILDTRLTWKQAEIDLLQDFGKTYDVAIAKKYQGMKVNSVVAKMIEDYHLPLSQKDGERILNEKIVANYANSDLELLPGCKNLVDELHRRNKFQLAIASSSPKAAIEAMVKRFGFTNYFAVRVSGEEVVTGKPEPDIFLHCAELLHIPPKNCLVLEDAPYGILAAKRAGMKTIAVYNKLYYSPEDFKGKADIVVCSLEKLSFKILDTALTF